MSTIPEHLGIDSHDGDGTCDGTLGEVPYHALWAHRLKSHTCLGGLEGLPLGPT